MNVDECYQLGYVVKPHGIKGELRLFLDVDFPEEYKDLESVYLQVEGKLIPFFVEAIQIQKQKAVVKLEEVDDIEMATSLKGKAIYLPLDQLPKLEEHQFYFHEVIGFTVIDKTRGNLGSIGEIYALPAQDLISIIYQEKEVLIPINDDIIIKVDKPAQEMYVDLPDGLIDLYLE